MKVMPNPNEPLHEKLRQKYSAPMQLFASSHYDNLSNYFSRKITREEYKKNFDDALKRYENEFLDSATQLIADDKRALLDKFLDIAEFDKPADNYYIDRSDLEELFAPTNLKEEVKEL